MTTKLTGIRHLALDMDGTIYSGGTLFEFSKPFLALITDLGMGYTFLTNNPSKNIKDYLAHLKKFGIDADESQLYTSTQSTLEFLQHQLPQAKRLFILGTASMCEEFTKAGFELTGDSHLDKPDAVVVGFDMSLTYSRLCRAAYWIRQGKPYVCTNPDRVCPTDQPTVLVDCGSLRACLQEATGIAPLAVLGKPHPSMLRGILHRHSLHPSELAMVGDRTYTDMAMAKCAGAVGVLVLTGETNREDAEKYSPAPDFILPSIKELGEKLKQAKRTALAA